MSPRARIPSEVFRERMKELRKARRLSQRALGERLAKVLELDQPIKQPVVAQIEAGRRAVSLDEAVAIARVLRVPLERLYTSWEDYLVMQAERSPQEAETAEEVRRQELGINSTSKEDQ